MTKDRVFGIVYVALWIAVILLFMFGGPAMVSGQSKFYSDEPSWLSMGFSLEGGLMDPQNNFGLSYREQQFYFDFAVRMFVLDTLYVGGSVATRFTPSGEDVIMFSPYSSLYWFEMGLLFKHFEIGFRHFCQHPSLIYGRVPLRDYEGGYEQLFVRVSGTLPLIRRRGK